MILAPTVLALVAASALSAVMMLLAAGHGMVILRRWDLSSGSERQLTLERRTYLATAIVANLLVFQLLSLFLFVHAADRIAPLLAGAMCAVGTLQANGYGFPALYLKLALFLLSGVWLALNHADNLAPDYPLIRAKYLLLLALVPLSVAEAVLQFLFFLSLKPDIITSCCGTLFGPSAGRSLVDLALLPPQAALTALGAAAVAVLAGAFLVARFSGRTFGLFLGVAGAIHLFVAVTAIISAVSPYIYELPTHHCPFCLLQGEYRYVGYLLYPPLLAVTVCAVGAGILAAWPGGSAADEKLRRFQRRLAGCAVAFEGLFLGGIGVCIATSNLTL